MALKDLTVRIGADTTGLDRGLKRAKAGLSSLAKTGLGLAAAAGATFGLKALEGAFVGLESSVLRVNSLFGDSARYIRYFAENTAKGFGMAESSAYQYAAIYGNLFKNITSGTAENSKVTVAMLKTSSVVASKTGRTMEDVMDRIRSGLLGNTEAIEDLGINVNVAMLESTDAFRRMANGRSWEKLTFFEQQQIRTLAILEQAHKNFGDEVQQGSAFSLSVLSGAFKDLMTTMGQFLNVGLQPIIKGLTQLVQWATAGLKALAALMGLKMTMGDTSGTDAATKAQEALTEEVEATGKAAKQTTAGFDVFNDITKATAATEGAGSADGQAGGSPFAGISMPEFEYEPETGWMTTFTEKLTAFRGLFDFSGIKESWANLKAALAPLGENIGAGLKWLWDEVLVPFGQYAVNEAIPAFFNTLAEALKTVDAAIDIVEPAFGSLWDAFRPAREWLNKRFVDDLVMIGNAFKAIGDALRWLTDLFGDFTVPILAFLGAGLLLSGWLSSVCLVISAVIAAGVLLAKNWDTVKVKAVELWDGMKEAFAPIGKFFSDLWEGVTSTFKSAVNVIIDLVNLLIRGLNNLQIKIPTWSPILPGKSFGVNIPEIPKLASGAIAYGEVQAIVGDNFNARQNPEVIAPLSNLEDVFVRALLREKIVSGGDSKEIRLTLVLENGEVLADMLIDPMNRKAKNLGYAPVFKPAT